MRRWTRPPTKPDDAAPWHDPAMPLSDRMKLAENRPLPRRMMAAMAQQDCSQCGYNCKDYADALFTKKEKRLNLCVPGGKETARVLKQLYQEIDGAALGPSRRSQKRRCPSAICPRRGARPLTRQSSDRDLPLTLPAQQARFEQRDLAHRNRSRGQRP